MRMPSRSILSVLTLAASVSACGDVTSPARTLSPAQPSFSGRAASDTSLVPGGGGGGAGGGGSVATVCGALSADIQAYNIVVYTTRVGIALSGSVTNCGTRNTAYEVDVVDTNPSPACVVNMPHYIAARNTAPGTIMSWSVNSTLVNCMNTTHTFTVTLLDANTRQVLASTTASTFL